MVAVSGALLAKVTPCPAAFFFADVVDSGETFDDAGPVGTGIAARFRFSICEASQ